MQKFAGSIRVACAWSVPLATFILVALLWPALACSQQVALTDVIAPLYHSDFRYVGSFSCAAVACHQGPRPGVAIPDALRGSEYGLWAERDPHARARDTLGTDESAAMLARLGIVRDDRVVDQKSYDNCLRCHALKPAEKQLPSETRLREGVGCEACHGPAEKWLVEHVDINWPRERGLESGMLDTRDLLVRARLCADCHVGSVDREVNHDMIAAGHPALRFEMSADHARLPKHWRDPRENEPDFEWSLWIAGQIASAEAALTLSQARLKDQATFQVWPEFSEFNCGDCHHALDVPTARQRPPHVARTEPRWGDWYYRQLAAIVPVNPAAAELPAKMSAGFIEKDAGLATSLSAVRQELNQWIQSHSTDLLSDEQLEEVSTEIRQLIGRQATDGAESWEQAAQIYLALRARDASRLRAENPSHPDLNALMRMRQALRFDEARESRLFFSAPRADSTIPYDVFHRELKQYVLRGPQP